MKSGMCDLVVFHFVQLLQTVLNIVVSDIIKRHIENKVYRNVWNCALISSEGPW